MKIGIISNYEWIQQWSNYGTVFQNYALQTYLGSIGHDTFWIRSTNNEVYSFTEKLANVFLKAVLEPVESVKVLRTRISGMFSDLEDVERIARFNKENPRYFEEFIKSYLPLSEMEYSGRDLRRGPPTADAYIVGSDNVWAQVSPAYFLDFGNPETLRIGYAVSANWSQLSNSWYFRARRRIGRIKFLSVREVQGLGVCEKLGRTDGVHVLDPTLMIDPSVFHSLVKSHPRADQSQEAVLLVYWLNSTKKDDWPLEAIKSFALKMKWKLQIIPLQGTELITPEDFLHTPDPIGWLHSFSTAEAIITNSFHGTAFSLIFEKPFVVLPKQSGESCEGRERFSSLLDGLDLGDRFLRHCSVNAIEEKICEEIDWPAVNRRLDHERIRSQSFLKTALQPCEV